MASVRDERSARVMRVTRASDAGPRSPRGSRESRPPRGMWIAPRSRPVTYVDPHGRVHLFRPSPFPFVVCRFSSRSAETKARKTPGLRFRWPLRRRRRRRHRHRRVRDPTSRPRVEARSANRSRPTSDFHANVAGDRWRTFSTPTRRCPPTRARARSLHSAPLRSALLHSASLHSLTACVHQTRARAHTHTRA